MALFTAWSTLLEGGCNNCFILFFKKSRLSHMSKRQIYGCIYEIYIYESFSFFVATHVHPSCVQVHELPQSHRGDNREGTLFS